MKVLHCLNQYLPAHHGGTEVYVHTLARLQQKDGVEVAIICPHIEFYNPGKHVPFYVIDEIAVYHYMEEANPTNRQVFFRKADPKGLVNFVSVIEKFQPDIIHFHELNRSIGLGVAHVVAARKFGAKIILTMHLSFYTCNTNTLIKNKKLCDGLIKTYDCTACTLQTQFKFGKNLSNLMAGVAIAGVKSGAKVLLPDSRLKTFLHLPEAISRIKSDLQTLSKVVHKFVAIADWYRNILMANGIDAHQIALIKQALPLEKEPAYCAVEKAKIKGSVRLVFLGRVQPQKALHLLLEVLKQFSENEFRLDVFAREEDTDYYQSCKKMAEDMPLVNWNGLLPRKDVICVLSQFDMLVLPSAFSEMSPLVIQEAFAARLPVLASKVYGNIEQVKDGETGLLFDFENKDSLKNKLLLILQSPELLIKFRKNILQPRLFNQIKEQYHQLYLL